LVEHMMMDPNQSATLFFAGAAVELLPLLVRLWRSWVESTELAMCDLIHALDSVFQSQIIGTMARLVCLVGACIAMQPRRVDSDTSWTQLAGGAALFSAVFSAHHDLLPRTLDFLHCASLQLQCDLLRLVELLVQVPDILESHRTAFTRVLRCSSFWHTSSEGLD
jgi:hypothetical protein